MADIRADIASQLYKALERLGAGPELLGIVGSYGDTLSDQEVLDSLKDLNKTGTSIHPAPGEAKIIGFPGGRPTD